MIIKMPVSRNLKKRSKKSPAYLVRVGMSKVKREALVKKMREVAKNTMFRNMETKNVVHSVTDGTEIEHNNFITLSNGPLTTAQGVQDGQRASDPGSRIGDDVFAVGYSIRMMIELNERYSDVTFRLLVVKCAKGDTPTRSTLFNGQSGNKMIDTINRERYTVLAQKWIKMKSPNYSIPDPVSGAGGAGSGIVYQSAGSAVHGALSRATKMVSLWVPGKKFGNRGRVQYEHSSTQVKFFDYHVLLYAYSNYSTLQDVYNVGRINDTVERFYFKDA